MTTKENVWYSVVHAVAQGAVWLGPIVILSLGSWGDLTVSGALSILVAYLNNHYLKA